MRYYPNLKNILISSEEWRDTLPFQVMDEIERDIEDELKNITTEGRDLIIGWMRDVHQQKTYVENMFKQWLGNKYVPEIHKHGFHIPNQVRIQYPYGGMENKELLEMLDRFIKKYEHPWIKEKRKEKK